MYLDYFYLSTFKYKQVLWLLLLGLSMFPSTPSTSTDITAVNSSSYSQPRHVSTKLMLTDKVVQVSCELCVALRSYRPAVKPTRSSLPYAGRGRRPPSLSLVLIHHGLLVLLKWKCWVVLHHFISTETLKFLSDETQTDLN